MGRVTGRKRVIKAKVAPVPPARDRIRDKTDRRRIKHINQ